MKYLTKAVLILSFVSFFTDIASEMLYPVMPVFLNSIGFSVIAIGILEGLAEAAAGLSKGYFGKMSDIKGRRVPFVITGYTLSAVSKPLVALFTYPFWIFFARTLDRLGKGIRTGARDALLAGESTPENKGKVFGFHRSMDTMGAVVGPAIALIYLHYNPGDYLPLFFIAFIPGILSVFITFFLREKGKSKTDKIKTSFFSFTGYWKQSPKSYRIVVAGLLLFALINSSDVFLLLKLKESGIRDTYIIGVYIFYNLIYALTSFPAGMIADKIGLKYMLSFGLLLFSMVYFGMSLSSNIYFYAVIFLIYGIYAASTEGISKALLTNISGKENAATAIGFYTGFQSIFTLLASSLAGFIWYGFGSAVLFIISGAISFALVFYFAFIKV